MKFKNKLQYFWDWYIVWYFVDKPKDIYKTIRHWWRCNGCNPYHWKMLWFTMFHHYGWDNSFCWELLRFHIQKSNYYFSRNLGLISEKHRSHILMWQRIAIGLLNIILEKRKLWEITKREDTKIDLDGDVLGGLEYDYKCLVYVNTRNLHRFGTWYTDYETGEITKNNKYMENEPHELYIEKARQLLLKIMDRYANSWWD